MYLRESTFLKVLMIFSFLFVLSCNRESTFDDELGLMLNKKSLIVQPLDPSGSVDIEVNFPGPMDPSHEVPPYTIFEGSWRTLFFSTAYTNFCSFLNNILLENLRYDDEKKYFNSHQSLSLGIWCHSDTTEKLGPSAANDRGLGAERWGSHAQWRRNYGGVFGAFVNDSSLYTINHGENKNEVKRNYFDHSNPVNNSINGDQTVHQGLSGSTDPYTDYYPAYFSFVYMDQLYWNSPMGYGSKIKREHGPIIWPANGYLGYTTDGSGAQTAKVLGNLKHPSIYHDDTYVYVFYLDVTSNRHLLTTNQQYRMDGIRVARALKSELNQVNPFKVLFNGSFQNPALPLDFDLADKENEYGKFREALSLQGPEAKTLFVLPHRSVNRFSVAKIRDTNYYLGLLSTSNYLTDKSELFYSYSMDLKSWSKPVLLADTADSSTEGLEYAISLDWWGTTNNEIDPDGFFILATHGGKIYRYSTSIVFE